MQYRELGHTGLKVSEIGLGCEHLENQSLDTVKLVINAAHEQGINILDIFMSEPNVRSNIGHAIKEFRKDFILQGHIGAGWVDGQYVRTRKRAECELFFEDFMTRLQTDYVDIGMLHYVDTAADYDKVFNTDIIDYAVELKKKGIIRAVGMSSHDPVSSIKAVKTGLIDVLMFSINPAYDILGEDVDVDGLFEAKSYKDEKLNGINKIRAELYQTCESMGVGITVMKGLGAGTLLDAKTSPFGVALTVHQAVNYALTRPAVSSVMIGARSVEQVREAASYDQTTPEQRDYSVILSQTAKFSAKGRCMYCNHCLPCPSRIDIAQVNKYLDMALLSENVPATVREHYLSMEHNAKDCIECGSCEKNCPFEVAVIEKMNKAKKIFKQ